MMQRHRKPTGASTSSTQGVRTGYHTMRRPGRLDRAVSAVTSGTDSIMAWVRQTDEDYTEGSAAR